jgi:hypothetical protein
VLEKNEYHTLCPIHFSVSLRVLEVNNKGTKCTWTVILHVTYFVLKWNYGLEIMFLCDTPMSSEPINKTTKIRQDRPQCALRISACLRACLDTQVRATISSCAFNQNTGRPNNSQSLLMTDLSQLMYETRIPPPQSSCSLHAGTVERTYQPEISHEWSSGEWCSYQVSWSHFNKLQGY